MLTDKVIIVTGAASGIGRETARMMADRGAIVIACDLGARPHGEGTNEAAVERITAEIRDRGGRAESSFGDVTDEAYVSALVEEVAEQYGRIDGAVNYAGFLRDNMSFNMPRADWEAVLDVHLGGHFNLIKHLGGHWRARFKAGDIEGQRSFVAVSSASARGSASQINYSAAKAGVLGLTRTAARELEAYNVRVNAMMPAAVTRMLDENLPDDALESLPADRLGPEKVAPLPTVLMSDHAEGLTGWTFAIGGDTLFTVTDPELANSKDMDGGWTADALPDAIADLLGEAPRAKTAPGGLLNHLI